VRGSNLVDRPSVSCGCRRADPNVRQAARTRMPARGRVMIALKRLGAPLAAELAPHAVR
jgi:hypothetical protein